MKPFLLHAAEYVLSKHNNLENILVVLPGKRGGLFLKKHLSELIKKPFFAPKISTIAELFEEATTEFVADKTTLLIHLFNSFNEAKNQESENFDTFLLWGNILLNDFSEIDRQLINAQDLYINLRNLQEIEDWSFNLDKLSAGQIDFETFWHTAGKTYDLFNLKCTEERINYSGRLYKKFALNIDKFAENLNYDKIYFCGFNALSKAEEKIIASLCYSGKAEILWDADDYYVSNPIHEAGYFYRKFKDAYPDLSTRFIGNYFSSEPKNIYTYACNGNIEQISALASIMTTKNEADINEAIVLCDESLIIPFLSNLPDRDKLNITMGYPIKYHHLFGFYKYVSEIIISKTNPDITLFYKLVNNPFFIKYFNYKALQNYLVANKITDLNNNHISAILPYFEPIEFIFNRIESIDDFNTAIRKISEKIKTLIAPSESIIYEIIQLINNNIQKIYHTDIIQKTELSLHSYKNLLFQLLQSESLSFIGEPLEGTQVMGMLETRALDFENLYLLSVNEDIIPKADFSNSFIPNDLKKLYGLPTRKEQDCIFANHFYRLLQRAKNVHLFYNAMPGVLGSNEPSRYLLEIENILTQKNCKIKFSKNEISFQNNLFHTNENIIHKNEHFYLLLDNKITKGLSPTSINTFIRCKLDFYYKVLLGIREYKDPNQQTGHDFIGNLFHAVLEKFYTDFLNKPIQPSDVMKLRNNSEKFISEIAPILDSYPFIGNAKYRLYADVCLNYLFRFCNYEQRYLEKNIVQVLHLEEEFSVDMDFNNKSVKLVGKIDRIDRENNVYRVIDYKTGKVEDKNLKISINDNLIDTKYDKALQLLVYAYLVFNKYPAYNDLKCGIYAIRQQQDMFKCLIVDNDIIINRRQLPDIENLIRTILYEMFEPGVLKHNEKSNYCVLCE